MEENQHQRWVNLIDLGVSFFVGFIFFSLFQKIVSTYDLEAKWSYVHWFLPGIAIGMGGIVFFAVCRHPRVNRFMNEVVAELWKVSWPNQKETVSMTFLVVVMVVISGILLGILDYGWIQLMKKIL